MTPSARLLRAVADVDHAHAEGTRQHLKPHPAGLAASDRIEARARDLLDALGLDPASVGDCAAAFAGIHAVLELGRELSAGTLEPQFHGDGGASLLVALSTVQGYLARRARP